MCVAAIGPDDAQQLLRTLRLARDKDVRRALARLVLTGANLCKHVTTTEGVRFVPFFAFLVVSTPAVKTMLHIYVRRLSTKALVRLKRMATDIRLYLSDEFGAGATARALFGAAKFSAVRTFAYQVEHAYLKDRPLDVGAVDEGLVASIAAACDLADGLRAFAVELSEQSQCHLLDRNGAQELGEDQRSLFLPAAVSAETAVSSSARVQ